MDATPRIVIVLLLVATLAVQPHVFPSIQPTRSVVQADVEPLSIILMIGDGMGYEHVELARLVEFGDSGSLNMQDSDWNATVTTHSANEEVTDSAAAATAMATGNKTNNGYLAVSPLIAPLETILEFAKNQNKSTGIVATSEITHATPAAFMTHVDSRTNTTEIARQIVEEADVDVLLGGGQSKFSGAQITTMISNGYSVVYNRTQLAAISSGKVFGLFADYHMDYEYDRDFSVQPSLKEMTSKSIELLEQDSDGFFLMVEGSRIDHAAHAEDHVRDALDTIAFDEAVKVAMDYVQENNNTILIVTADHETEGLVILSHNLNSELPASLISEEDKRTLRIDRANNVTANWTATYHTNWSVPLFGYGTVFSELSSGVTINNTEIFFLMKNYYMGNPFNETEEPPTTTKPPVTSTTTTTTTTTTTITTTTTPSSTTPTITVPPSDSLFFPMLLGMLIGATVVILVALVLIKRKSISFP
jgi:alkaline phosphatase